MKKTDQTDNICALYSVSLSEKDAQEAASNLLAFMELLIEIDMEHGISCASESGRQP